MSQRIAIVHYTPPGIVGGVELIIGEQARLLRSRGHDVLVIAGRSASDSDEVRVLPEIDAATPESMAVEAELANGVVSPRFYRLRDSIAARIGPLLSSRDVVLVHNAYTLHFSMPLTSVLWELAAQRPPTSMVAWCHDLAWANQLYTPAMHSGYPWDLLRVPAPGVRYVVVSKERQTELSALWDGDGRADILVAPNGIDPYSFLGLSPETRAIVHRFRLFDREMVLLLPVRVTRRKNVELAMRAVRCLRDRDIDVCFLVTGPVAPHHPSRSQTYLDELKRLREDLALNDAVIFAADELGHNLDYATVAQLYRVVDALLFPSSQEGFGLPILEAGLARIPVVLADIPVFREVGGADVWTFELGAAPDDVADRILEAVQGRPSALYRRVLREYRWDAIIDQFVTPLLRAAASTADTSAIPHVEAPS